MGAGEVEGGWRSVLGIPMAVPRPVRLMPTASPPFRREGRAIDTRPRPVDPVGPAEAIKEDAVEPVADPAAPPSHSRRQQVIPFPQPGFLW